MPQQAAGRQVPADESFPRATDKPRIFVSYSRKDEGFAQELVAGLMATGFEPLLDKRDIVAGEDWETRLQRLIEAAETVVYIISPDSIASRRCAWEVEQTEQLGKRLIPVVWRQVEESAVPERLKRLNYVFFDKPMSFGSALAALATALRTDLGWVREHARLLARAHEWLAAGRAHNRLLSGEDIARAKTWLERSPGAELAPTELHRNFIRASSEAETVRLSTERQRAETLETAVRRMRWALAGIAGFAILSLAAASWALRSQSEAARQAQAAEKTLDYIVDNALSGWPRSDAESPDYRHLATTPLGVELKGGEFVLTPAAIDALLAANGFEPTLLDGRFVLAARGAVLAPGTDAISAPRVRLTDARPDHVGLKSLMIVVDRPRALLSAFPASTEPNKQFVRRSFLPALRQRIGLAEDDANARSNLMPTGAYAYIVGAHAGGRLPGSLRQHYEGDEPVGIAVRRSFNDMSFTLDDEWDVALVYNNLHISYSLESFSSAGALTVRGTFDPPSGRYNADFELFRQALGLGYPAAADHGKRVDVVLVTGLDLAIAARLIEEGKGTIEPVRRAAQLERVRAGSRGPSARKLQAALGLTPGAYMSPEAVKRLAELQLKTLGWSDGIYSREMESLLGLCVYGPAC